MYVATMYYNYVAVAINYVKMQLICMYFMYIRIHVNSLT